GLQRFLTTRRRTFIVLALATAWLVFQVLAAQQQLPALYHGTVKLALLLCYLQLLRRSQLGVVIAATGMGIAAGQLVQLSAIHDAVVGYAFVSVAAALLATV